MAHPIVEPGASSLPTPTAQRYGSSVNGSLSSRPAARAPSLWTLARKGLLPTPTCGDAKRSGKASAETLAKNSRPLSEVAGGHLHPRFVEWMMGLVQDWTDPG